MDINDLRSLITVLGFALFLVLVARVWKRHALPSHERAARLVFEGESEAGGSGVRHRGARQGRNKEVQHG